MADRLKMKCYYTDYVVHIIRFYLSTPETLHMEGKRKADIENWLAAQDIFRRLSAEDRETLEKIFVFRKLQDGIRVLAEETGADERKYITLLTKTCAAIAKRRGLV